MFKAMRAFTTVALFAGLCMNGFCATAEFEVLDTAEVDGVIFLDTMAHSGRVGYGHISLPDFSSVPFRWSPDSGVELINHVLPFDGISDTSADGSVVVGTVAARSETGLLAEPYHWSAETGPSLPDGPETLPSFLNIHRADAVSGDGTVVLINRNDQDYFLWDTVNGTVTPTPLFDTGGSGRLPARFPNLLTFNPIGSAVGANGSTVGSNKSMSHDGSLWVGSILVDGGLPAAAIQVGAAPPRVIGPTSSVALLTTPDGGLTVGSFELGDRPGAGEGGMFVWSEGKGFQDLGRYGFAETVPTGLTDDGELIVGYSRNTDDDYEFFIWTPDSGYQDVLDYFLQEHELDLAPLGYSVFDLVSVSGDGKVFAGHGFDPGRSSSVSFIITVVPEPHTALLALCTLTCLAVGRARNV